MRRARLVLGVGISALVSASLAGAPTALATSHALSPRSLPADAHGSITGAGPHNGVPLVLVAWPKGKNYPVGHKLHLQVIGHATSSSSGTYSISPNVALPKGLHNLEILARSHMAVGAFGFPRKVTAQGTLVAVDGHGNPGPVTANIHMMALPKSERTPARSPLFTCSPIVTKTKEFGPRMVKVGGLYNLMTNGKMKEIYSAGASTTMGIGIGLPGGGFSAEGTFTQTTSTTEPFPTVKTKIVNEETPYTFGEYHVCQVSQVQPEVWVLGSRLQKAKAPQIDKCSLRFPKGQVITRQSGKAGTFSAGVSVVIEKDLAINLSAQSGYTQNVKIRYTFQAGGGYLCGSNNYPSASAWDVMEPCNTSGSCVKSLLGSPAGRTSRSR